MTALIYLFCVFGACIVQHSDTTVLAAGIGGALVTLLISVIITAVTIAIIYKERCKNPNAK